jgi:5-methylcytosine-specific restriction enzyme A
MTKNIMEVLESLRPTRSAAIMDVVAAAGIDTSGWAVKQDGSAVSDPKKNPNYCYEWAFGGDDEPTLLCVWHRSLRTAKEVIEFEDSLRQHALGLDLIAIDRAKPGPVRSRARDQAKRGRNFDSLLQRAYRASNPIRVALLVGDQRSRSELGLDASKVKYRLLDPEPWYVHSYSDGDGSFRMVRGVPLNADPEARVDAHASEATQEDSKADEFVDQFELRESPEKQEVYGSVYPRSKEVRDAVLHRAGGFCEHCSKPGFETDKGAIFLETHHVIPLAEEGPDEIWNVVALCPNDHRRAHFAFDRLEMHRGRRAEKRSAFRRMTRQCASGG